MKDRDREGQDDGGWRRTDTRYLFRSRWYDLRQDRIVLPDGQDATYTFVEHPGYVMVVPLLDDGRVVMESIFRHTLQRTLLECPSGGIEGEAPERAARRELEEETGYLADDWHPLGSFYGSSGISDERFHLYLARGLRAEGEQCREPTEQMEIVERPLDELHAAALAGEIEDAPSALALLLAHRRVAGG